MRLYGHDGGRHFLASGAKIRANQSAQRRRVIIGGCPTLQSNHAAPCHQPLNGQNSILQKRLEGYSTSHDCDHSAARTAPSFTLMLLLYCVNPQGAHLSSHCGLIEAMHLATFNPPLPPGALFKASNGVQYLGIQHQNWPSSRDRTHCTEYPMHAPYATPAQLRAGQFSLVRQH